MVGYIVNGYPMADLNECWINVYWDDRNQRNTFGYPHSSLLEASTKLSINKKIYRIHVRMK